MSASIATPPPSTPKQVGHLSSGDVKADGVLLGANGSASTTSMAVGEDVRAAIEVETIIERLDQERILS